MTKQELLQELSQETYIALKPSAVHDIGVFAITDMNKFKTAMASDAKKKLMGEAGVIGQPVMTFFQNEK